MQARAKDRFYELDILRFLCAMSVIMYHFVFRGYAVEGFNSMSFEYLGPASQYGYLGVHLFFIISGFVILFSATNKTATGFFIARMARLLPAYWVCVTITYVIRRLIEGGADGLSILDYLINLTMMQSYVGVEPMDGVYWTLAIELRFYFLIFIIAMFNQINKLKYLLGIWLIITLISVGYENKLIDALFFPMWSHYFIAGACFYLICKDGNSLYYFFLIALSYILAIYRVFYGDLSIDFREELYGHSFDPVVIISVITVFYTIFYIIATGKINLPGGKLVATVGALTYPLYLIHCSVGFPVLDVADDAINKYILLTLVSALVIFIAYIINIFIENRYAGKFRKNLTKLAGNLGFDKLNHLVKN